jgi:phage N-6-adenine-methyltransferase
MTGRPADRDTWTTPLSVYRWAQHVAGGAFDYDAACDSNNALATPLWSRPEFTPGDSLSHRWPDGCRIFCNPPYSDIDPWVAYALGCASLTAMLIMSPNGEERFFDLIPNAFEFTLVGRIGFLGANGKPINGNTRGSSLFLINAGQYNGQRRIIRRSTIFRDFS